MLLVYLLIVCVSSYTHMLLYTCMWGHWTSFRSLLSLPWGPWDGTRASGWVPLPTDLPWLHLKFFFFLRQGLMEPRLGGNSLCSRGWLNSWPSCLHLLGTGITGVHHGYPGPHTVLNEEAFSKGTRAGTFVRKQTSCFKVSSRLKSLWFFPSTLGCS